MYVLLDPHSIYIYIYKYSIYNIHITYKYPINLPYIFFEAVQPYPPIFSGAPTPQNLSFERCSKPGWVDPCNA